MSSAEPVDRSEVLAAVAAWQEVTRNNDWDGFVDLFPDDCSFVNSMMPAPVLGREALRAFVKEWPSGLVNTPEWIVVDGDRAVVCWNERIGHAPRFRGISAFVYAGGGLFSHYEAMIGPTLA